MDKYSYVMKSVTSLNYALFSVANLYEISIGSIISARLWAFLLRNFNWIIQIFYGEKNMIINNSKCTCCDAIFETLKRLAGYISFLQLFSFQIKTLNWYYQPLLGPFVESFISNLFMERLIFFFLPIYPSKCGIFIKY